MRTVTFGVANSLDNFVARADGAVDWLQWTEEVAAFTRRAEHVPGSARALRPLRTKRNGSLMQVKGQSPVTLEPGDTFYEGNEDVHLVGRNASRTSPARFVVFLVKEKAAPAVLPAQ